MEFDFMLEHLIIASIRRTFI